MVTTNVYSRTFFIRTPSATYGTAFTIDVDNKQYIVSASHLFGENHDEINKITDIQIQRGNQWESIPITIVGIAKNRVDIVVLKTDRRLGILDLPVAEGRPIGQDVYFVGFPYKMHISDNGIFNGFPISFVKKGVLSAIENDNGAVTLFVDAINNEGFSGGPLVCAEIFPIAEGVFVAKNNYRVFGVVSKFKTETEPVIAIVDYKGEKINIKTNMIIEYNTGFLVGYDIKHALDLIGRNPIGFELTNLKNGE